jgi:hypothetical protein
MDWQMDRDACKRLIADAGLPVPVKSACFFCPASKQHEVVELRTSDPELHGAALVLEDRYRDGKHYRRDEPKAVQGLGIRRRWSEELLN